VTVSLVRAVAPMAATALVGCTVVVVVTLATEWKTNGWAWLLAVAGLTVISGGVSWWLHGSGEAGRMRDTTGPTERPGSPGAPPTTTSPDSAADDSGALLSSHAESGRVTGPRIENVQQHEKVGTRAAAAVVMPFTAEGEPSSVGLVGRDQELAALLAVLDPRPAASAGGIVSVVSGTAGVGKTALVEQAARTTVALGWFPGGALVVDLHGDDPDPGAQVAPDRVYAPLLRALDPSLAVEELPATVEEQASAYHQMMSHLDQLSRPVLLVIENGGDSDEVIGLLPAGRAHRVLITSRHTLGELPGARLLDLDVLASELAVELLGARRPGDPRLGADPEAAAELARLCGHLPLALQIIAVLLADDPARSTADLVKELAKETHRLQGLPGDRWVGRPAVELSYRHLGDAAARLFRLVAMVPGADVTAPAAAALADQPVEQVRQSLAALTRAQLLECHRPGRWRMHDLLRLCATEFATVHAQPDGQEQAIARLLGHYRDTTHTAARRSSARPTPQISNDFDTVAHALDWLRAERANLVAAVARAAGTPTHLEYSVDIALGLAQFLDRERHLEDWTATATTAVHAATGLGDHHREAAALNNLGSALAEVGRFEEAITSYHQAAHIYCGLSDHHGEGKALNNLGSALIEVDRFEEAITSHHQAAGIYRKLRDHHGEGRALGNLGLALIEVRRLRDAREALEQASTLFVALRAYDDADRVVGLLTTLND
jgi:tetratricopeptide (TPR) repeat protein